MDHLATLAAGKAVPAFARELPDCLVASDGKMTKMTDVVRL
ncbi:hypothetical protein THTE_2286 [Thermogutta terrifontis]|uniref:Uncharacterized protein n=1 Tax=Thermogutta terrifontis TaxID=1331910 RepID=A0A286RFZ9_9BACT|nr:hypothetical protein THTE_2286 [Thermogutta terrifontis]